MKILAPIKLLVISLSTFAHLNCYSCQNFSGIYQIESPEKNCQEYGRPGHPGSGISHSSYGVNLRVNGQLEIIQRGCDFIDLRSIDSNGEVREKLNIKVGKKSKEKIPDDSTHTVVENIVTIKENQLALKERLVIRDEASLSINNLYFSLKGSNEMVARTESKICGFGAIIFEQKICSNDLGTSCKLTRK